MAVSVFESRNRDTGVFQRDPAELVRVGDISAEVLRDYLLALFISTATERDRRYRPDQVERWLSSAAYYLEHRRLESHSSPRTDIILHDAWLFLRDPYPRWVGRLVAFSILLFVSISVSMFPAITWKVSTFAFFGVGRGDQAGPCGEV
ncbi:hypothetical protein, partial [Nocardia seriolae]|uniref:hypothetical protein n=1 Tax=Nocardia seriolae TaxID=37332 RepID=UPI001C0D8F7B